MSVFFYYVGKFVVHVFGLTKVNNMLCSMSVRIKIQIRSLICLQTDNGHTFWDLLLL